MTIYNTYDTEYGPQNYFGNFTCFQKCILIILLLQFNQPMVFAKVYQFDQKSGFSTFLSFWSPFRPYWSTGVDQMLTKKFFSERSLQSDSKMYLHRSDISNIREVTIGDVLRRSGP